MAECKIDDVGIILNDSPVNGAGNPWECHSYKHQIKFTEYSNFFLHVKWSITGDIPKGISIDSATGLISGTIKFFPEQPSCQDNESTNVLEEDGSNYKDIGRFKHPYYDFNFTVRRDYLIDSDPSMPPPIGIVPESTESNITIRVIKNNDIDNMIFVYKYLEAGHSINIEDKKYTFDNVDEALAVHKGPFADCPTKTEGD